jgi:flagellar motility protein MotE (MotC chaperone)
MKQRSRQIFRPFTVTLLMILSVLVLKLALTVFNFSVPKNNSDLSLFASEVMAEDRKAKTKKTVPPAKPEDPGQAAPAPDAPKRPSNASVPEMVTYLETRNAELNKKEEQLKQKEEYLSQMEQQVEGKLKELLAIQKEIQAFRAEREENQNAKVRSLAKIYGTMKPKEAAKLLENLEEQLVVEVISTMNATEAANILSNMDVKKAAKISQALSHR